MSVYVIKPYNIGYWQRTVELHEQEKGQLPKNLWNLELKLVILNEVNT